MSFLNTIFGFFPKISNRLKYSIGATYQPIETNGVTGLPERIATVFTCCDVLASNLSRMPLYIQAETDWGKTELKNHRLSYLLKFKPNGYQNPQQFWNTIEYHRNYYGNAFARIYKNNYTGFVTSLEIIHPGYVKEYYFEAGRLFWKVYNFDLTRDETIPDDEILHFRGLSEDGIVGLSPLVAISRQTNINERATATMDNFYKNNATAPGAMSTELPAALSAQGKMALDESIKMFNETNVGPENAGKLIRLPLGSKIQSLAMQFADAQLIQTLEYTRQDISAAYHVPLFMVDGSAEKLDVEQLTTLFKNNTMGPICAIYTAELNAKLLRRDELEAGLSVTFDIMSLIALDFAALVSGISEQVAKGLMTPNEGAKKLGNKPIAGEYGNYHYTQAQNIPFEKYGQYNPLLKNDPNLKTNRSDDSNE